MRRKLVLSLAIAALIALTIAAVAAAEKPITVKAGNLVLTFNGGVSPKALSKTKMEPISLNVSGKISTADGTPPTGAHRSRNRHRQERHDRRPRRADLQTGPARSADDGQRRKGCKPAMLGTGTTDVEVLFPESNPIQIHSKLLAFNGGTKGGTTTLYIHAYLTSPIAAAIVTTVKISKEHKGPYGTRSVASIPKIAGGAGSVTAFSLTFPKKLFTYKGKKHGYLLAKCSNGKFLAQAEAKFSDGTKVGPAQVVRACTPKG